MARLDSFGVEISAIMLTEQSSTPETPQTGKAKLFLMSDGLYLVDDAGLASGPLGSAVGSSSFVGCRVHQVAPSSLSSSWSTMNFGAEDFDTNEMHDNEVNTSRIVIKVSGKYSIGASIGTAANATLGGSILVDGTTTIAAQVQGNSGLGERVSLSTIYDLIEDQYVEVQGICGSSQNSLGDEKCSFWVYKIG